MMGARDDYINAVRVAEEAKAAVPRAPKLAAFDAPGLGCNFTFGENGDLWITKHNEWCPTFSVIGDAAIVLRDWLNEMYPDARLRALEKQPDLPDCPDCLRNDPAGTHTYGTKQHGPEPDAKGAEVQRWTLYVTGSGSIGSPPCLMSYPSPDGEWVKHEQHAAAMEAMKQRAEKMWDRCRCAEDCHAHWAVCISERLGLEAEGKKDADDLGAAIGAIDALKQRATTAEAELAEAAKLLDEAAGFLRHEGYERTPQEIEAFRKRTEKR